MAGMLFVIFPWKVITVSMFLNDLTVCLAIYIHMSMWKSVKVELNKGTLQVSRVPCEKPFSIYNGYTNAYIGLSRRKRKSHISSIWKECETPQIFALKWQQGKQNWREKYKVNKTFKYMGLVEASDIQKSDAKNVSSTRHNKNKTVKNLANHHIILKLTHTCLYRTCIRWCRSLIRGEKCHSLVLMVL